jgi:hypothetical protein
MLINRIRPEVTEGTLYHYCSAQTLLSILKNRTIRFSDVTLLNDGQEGAWGYHVLQQASERLSRPENIPEGMPNIPPEFFAAIREWWLSLSMGTRHFVACFSADGDSLSQWRAYADDGRGFSVGFKAKEIRSQLPIQIYDVLYDEEQQIQEMTEALGATYLEFVDKGSDYNAEWFTTLCAELAALSVSLKNPAWRDEKEIRCHHLVVAAMTGEKWVLKDPGGHSAEGKVAPQPVQFEARNGLVVPFLDLPFTVSASGHPIEAIVTGPKCPTDELTLRFLLGGEGYGNVPIRFAGSAYR